jgi:hypothetical protein
MGEGRKEQKRSEKEKKKAKIEHELKRERQKKTRGMKGQKRQGGEKGTILR